LSNTEKYIKTFNIPNFVNYKFDEIFENSIMVAKKFNRIFANKLKLTSFDYFQIFQVYIQRREKNSFVKAT